MLLRWGELNPRAETPPERRRRCDLSRSRTAARRATASTRGTSLRALREARNDRAVRARGRSHGDCRGSGAAHVGGRDHRRRGPGNDARLGARRGPRMRAPPRLIIDGRPLQIFPLTANKTPLIKDWRNAARTDVDHSGWPMVGVPTGEATFDVFDFDVPCGTTWLAGTAPQLIEMTRSHATPSGGVHLLFKPSGLRNSQSKFARGVDVRGEGGYVGWHPARGHRVLNDGLIQPLPTILSELVGQPQQAMANQQSTTANQQAMTNQPTWPLLTKPARGLPKAFYFKTKTLPLSIRTRAQALLGVRGVTGGREKRSPELGGLQNAGIVCGRLIARRRTAVAV